MAPPTRRKPDLIRDLGSAALGFLRVYGIYGSKRSALFSLRMSTLRHRIVWLSLRLPLRWRGQRARLCLSPADAVPPARSCRMTNFTEHHIAARSYHADGLQRGSLGLAPQYAITRFSLVTCATA